MNFFSIIPEGQAIVHQRGVYRQVPIYERDGKVYAKYGAGFVRLIQGGSTSAINIRWAEIDPGQGSHEERSGYVFYTAPVEAMRVLEAAE